MSLVKYGRVGLSTTYQCLAIFALTFLVVRSAWAADDYPANSSTTGTVPVGGTITGSLEASGDADWFSVSLTAGNQYRFDVRGVDSGGGTLSDPILALRNASGTVLADDDDSGTGYDPRITYTATTTDTYFLTVTGYGLGTYTVAAAVNLDAPNIVTFSVPTATSGLEKITKGPDGALWFTEHNSHKIGRITTAGVITEYTISTAANSPDDIVAGADGALWYVDSAHGNVGRITTSGAQTAFTIPTAGSLPFGIAAGPDGNLWFTEGAFDKIGVISTSGAIREFRPSPTTIGSGYSGITTGPDGNLWFATQNSKVGKVTTDGTFTMYSVPSPFFQLKRITSGPDGNIWFADRIVSRIGKITTNGAVTGYAVGGFGFTNDIVAGPDGAMWFTYSGNIGRITTNGTITLYPVPGGSTANSITVGPDGNIWFTDSGTNKIGRLIPPVAPVLVSSIFSTSQSASQSFLRFHNTGNSAGTVAATLYDSGTGQSKGTWTSSSIPAGAELQFAISAVESAAGISGTKPSYYYMSLRSTMAGYFQHVLFRPSDGTLTNLSTCASGVTADRNKIGGVHSSLLSAIGFPSSISVSNTGTSAASATLGIFDARDGTRLGTYATSSIPANGELLLTISAIETAIGRTPTGAMYHYVINIENSFTGYIQHLVNNQTAGVITDMTTACSLAASASTAAVAPQRGGPLFSTAQSQSQSFLRFHNTGTSASTARVALYDATTGQQSGQWTSPSIPAGAEIQYAISTVEAEAGIVGPKPSYYGFALQASFNGFFQHVLFRPTDGTLTNLSTCVGGVTASPTVLGGVHTSLLDSLGFPSVVTVTNTGSSAAAATLGIYDARDGTRLGSYTTASIPSNGESVLSVASLETAMGRTPNGSMYHYVIKIENTFFGYLQHLVNNQRAGVTTDMTTSCTLTASAEPLPSASPPVTLNFDSVAGATVIPGAICYDLTSYLATYGVTISQASAGSLVTAGAANACFHSDVVVSSPPNALYVLNNQPVSFTMNFDRPMTSIKFTRARMNAGINGVNTVGWSATAYNAVDAGGSQVAEVSETTKTAFSPSFIAAADFTLTGIGIRSVRFVRTNPSGQNTFYGVSFPVIDDLVLTPQ